MNIFKVAWLCFSGIMLGCVAIGIYVSSQRIMHDYIQNHIQTIFEEKYGCALSCSIEDIDPLSLQIHISNIMIKPLEETNGEWYITADLLTLSVSWIKLFTSMTCSIKSSFKNMIIHEKQPTYKSDLWKFLQKLFVFTPNQWIQYESISFHNTLLLLSYADTCDIHVNYTSHVSFEKQGLRIVYWGKHGEIMIYKKPIISSIAGSFIWDIPYTQFWQKTNIQTNITFKIPSISTQEQFTLHGTLNKNTSSLTIKNDLVSCIIDPIILKITSKKCLFDITMSLQSDFLKQIIPQQLLKDVQGALKVTCRGNAYDFFNTIQLDITTDTLYYHNKKYLEDAHIWIHYTPDKKMISGICSLNEKQWLELALKTKHNTIDFSLWNTLDIPLSDTSYWKIPNKKAQFQCYYTKKNELYGSYDITIEHEKKSQSLHIQGSWKIHNGQLHIEGSCNQKKYTIIINVTPSISLESLSLTEEDKTLLHFFTNTDKALEGEISFSFIQELVPESMKASFAQEGAFQFLGTIKNGIYYSEVKTHQSNIRIPNIYNVIQDITASCEMDLYNKTITLKNIVAKLHEGIISATEAIAHLDTTGSPYFIHAPCILDSVLMSWDKGIFMLMSGNMLLQYEKQKESTLSGTIIIEKSQLKENLISSQFQQNLLDKIFIKNSEKEELIKDINLDISFYTKDLLHIKTAFFSSNARIDMNLQGSIKKPILTGVVHLTSGAFHFPYKPLFIAEGTLFFTKEQQFDPLLDILAKAKLKRFEVSMQVTGSVFDPKVQFEATPYLSEEQIISLLLIGIEEQSLSIMIPALLTQKLKDLIFAPSLTKSKLKSKFERFFKSLKYFRFLPQFTNQTGRGGMRGIFEVDASDHIHGKIDTNFMQLEDTKFEFDFNATDDITFRTQKDGPSTYGGEVEFRWKFD